MKKIILAALLPLFCLTACQAGQPVTPDQPSDEPVSADPASPDPSAEPSEEPIVIPPFDYEVSYVEDESNFCNPERGLYVPAIKYFRNGRMPTASTVESLRRLRDAGKTFSYSEFYVMDYVYKDFSEEVLTFIREHLALHREAGIKTIVRFAYSDGYGQDDHPWDAPLEQTLRHVEQLKPIFQEFEDVIYVVQYGFVGSWGEGYYTDNYGMNPKTDEDYWSRRQLMNALLEAVPVSRQVAVRYPLYKRGILGMELKDTITAETAFGPSQVARVAAFNDCFVSAADDVGTYKVAGDRDMWEIETNYCSMGGETCAAPEAYCNCDKTYANLIRFHWTYLNEAYNHKTHSVWRKGGCYDDIVKRLGYRFVLKGAAFGGDKKPGGTLEMKLHLKNLGFASIINKRPLKWVITDGTDSFVIDSPTDPRTWRGSHEYVYEETIALPAELQSGKQYRLCMYLPDAAPTLCDKSDFAIRLANEGVWDEKTGYNTIYTFTAE